MKVLSTPVCNSITAMVTDLGVTSLIIQEEHGIQCMPCLSQIISEILSDIHTMKKCDFLKPISHSQII